MVNRDGWIGAAVTALAEVFNRQLSAPAIGAYVRAIEGLPDEQLRAALDNAAKTLRFMPAPAELREMAGVLSDKDRAIQAWDEVLRAVPMGPYRHIDFEDGTINATIRNLGGWPNFLMGFDTAENEGWTRQRFVKAYESLAKGRLTGDVVLPLPGLSQVDCVGGELVAPQPVRIAMSKPSPSDRPRLKGPRPKGLPS